MNTWENAVITVKGLSLLAKLVAGNTLAITKAVTGSGTVTAGTLQNQTDVSDIKQTLTFSDTTYPSDGKCALTCGLNNTGLTAGYTANQVGIYATDPDDGEILFFIAQATTGTEIPSESEMPGYSAEWTFYFQYGQADGVSVTVDPAAAVTQAKMEAYIASTIQTATNAEIDAAYNAALAAFGS